MAQTCRRQENLLSLVLATVDRTMELERCLESMARQDDQEFEVILVDQNMDHRLAAIVQYYLSRGLNVVHVRIGRRSLSYARNAGLVYARGSLIGFPDDDCWYEPNTVRSVRSAFVRGRSADYIIGHWMERSGTQGISHELEPSKMRRFRSIPIASICVFVRAKWIERMNGFDERLGVGTWCGSSEETDLVLRMSSAGARGHYDPSVVVHHHWQSRPLMRSCRDIWRGGRARARGTGVIYAKHKLGRWVVVRGVVTPVIRFHPSIKGFVAGVATSYGRLEGFLWWKNAEADHD